jgi:hypothetical protein
MRQRSSSPPSISPNHLAGVFCRPCSSLLEEAQSQRQGFSCNFPARSQNRLVLDLTPFQNLPLRGGFTLVETTLTAKPLLDPIERAASAQTLIRGKKLYILLRADLDEAELSLSLYHEILEAATVGAHAPPPTVLEFNESHFEAAARDYHHRLGVATPESLNQMLADFGF